MFAWQQTESSAGALEKSGAHAADSIMVYIPTYKHPYSSCVAKQEPEGMLCSPKSILDSVTLGDW